MRRPTSRALGKGPVMLIKQMHDGSFSIVGMEYDQLEEIADAICDYADHHVTDYKAWLERFRPIFDALTASRQVDTATQKNAPGFD